MLISSPQQFRLGVARRDRGARISFLPRQHIPQAVEQLREQAEKTLEAQIEKIEQAGGTVAGKHLRTAERHRAEQIVRVAEEMGAGLIVMGSRGLGGVRGALMGSVSDSVVRHAHCPVLIVRPEDT
jgi:nucleotide-binding universal stress UspA family protein